MLLLSFYAALRAFSQSVYRAKPSSWPIRFFVAYLNACN